MPHSGKTDIEGAAKAYTEFMRLIGMDCKSPHAKGTPERVARMFVEFTAGLREPDFTFTVFPKNARHAYDHLIVQRDIPLYSLCAHHHLPFFGVCGVGYLPDKDIIGLSKIARVVVWKSRKPSIQEDLTEEIADVLWNKLNPRALFVHIVAEHLCLSSRGVQQPGTKTVTHCLRGDLALSMKEEFLKLIGAE